MSVDAASYLWQPGQTCLRWADDCFDLETAARLRVMAEDFLAKSEEIERELRRGLQATRGGVDRVRG